MLRFGGFKASLNFSSGKRSSSDYVANIPSSTSTKGAYRANREEFVENGSFSDPPKKITPSMVKLPPSSKINAVKPSKSVGDLTQSEIPKPPPLPPSNEVVSPTKSTSDLRQTVNVKTPTVQPDTNSNVSKVTSKLAKTKIAKAEPKNQRTIKTAKSTSELHQVANVPPKLRKSAPDVSSDPRGDPSYYKDSADLRKVNSKDSKKQEKEKKLIEKKRLAEQKKNEKLAAQEQAKQEKLRKGKEKQEAKLAKQKAKKDKKKGKEKDMPVPKPRTNPLAQATPGPLSSETPAQPQGPAQYMTNTLESSISRTSGPPAYTDIPAPKANIVQNENDTSGNTSFTKKVVNSDYSWDIIAQHRQQISRPPVTGGGKPTQKVMDLQYLTGRPSEGGTEA